MLEKTVSVSKPSSRLNRLCSTWLLVVVVWIFLSGSMTYTAYKTGESAGRRESGNAERSVPILPNALKTERKEKEQKQTDRKEKVQKQTERTEKEENQIARKEKEQRKKERKENELSPHRKGQLKAASAIQRTDGGAGHAASALRKRGREKGAGEGGGGAAAGADTGEPFDPAFWERVESKRQTIENTDVPVLNQSWAHLFDLSFLTVNGPTKTGMLKTTGHAKENVVQRKKYYITYGQNCCNKAKKLACKMALTHGFDECFAFDLKDVDKAFQEKHAKTFNTARGAGLWLWKPYLIYQMLGIMEEGDYLVYADAGAHLTSPIHPLLGWMEHHEELQGVLTFSVGFPQSQFCKRDAFITQRCDTDACHAAGQIDGYVSAWRKGSHAVKLHECQDYHILSDEENTGGSPNLPGFKTHRHDQALLTNIFEREGWARDTIHARAHSMFKHDRHKD